MISHNFKSLWKALMAVQPVLCLFWLKQKDIAFLMIRLIHDMAYIKGVQRGIKGQ